MVMPAPPSTYPGEPSVDFGRLKAATLQRYVDYHQLPLAKPVSKDDLAIHVAKHFNETVSIAADEEETILSFLTFIRKQGSAVARDATRRARVQTAGSTIKRRRDRTADDLAAKKAKRKEKRYCTCDGESFGEMIACDNKACSDRANWYHMPCVGLTTTPETWLCPSCQEDTPESVPENRTSSPTTLDTLSLALVFRKPALSTTYGDMIATALRSMPKNEVGSARKVPSQPHFAQGTFKEICDYIEAAYESQLNWKLESDQRKSPVWKSSVRKILFSNSRFKRHAIIKGLFCLTAS
ncbi:hypothetical protein ACHHYP_02607 [Achlya hypogyna]|uniref:Zinc finger PHD-type domain-containing protein n=1 Tax=Achlya hypogyna TaxID=1202772 RepID=A0A1V9Z6A8_ACHHY|nr:hypothetical protein ACHHYP_02607 [Achlya hypogyna]